MTFGRRGCRLPSAIALVAVTSALIYGCGGHHATVRAWRPRDAAPSSAPTAGRPPRVLSRAHREPVTAATLTHGPRRGRLLALTFDADLTYPMLARIRAGRAPEQIDRSLFSELRATRTPATIFLTGLWTRRYPGFVRGLARDRQFELEDHSYDHRAWTATCFGLPTVLAAGQQRAEVTRTQQAIKQVTGLVARYFRFPGGCSTPAGRRLVAGLGLRTAGWDVVSGDAFQSDPRVIVRAVLAGVRPGSIIVAHCIGAPNTPATASAMIDVISALKAQGYRFVTLRDLQRGRLPTGLPADAGRDVSGSGARSTANQRQAALE